MVDAIPDTLYAPTDTIGGLTYDVQTLSDAQGQPVTLTLHFHTFRDKKPTSRAQTTLQGSVAIDPLKQRHAESICERLRPEFPGFTATMYSEPGATTMLTIDLPKPGDYEIASKLLQGVQIRSDKLRAKFLPNGKAEEPAR